jgi:hypothetical protein
LALVGPIKREFEDIFEKQRAHGAEDLRQFLDEYVTCCAVCFERCFRAFRKNNAYAYIGGNGTRTPLHRDLAHTSALNVMVGGSEDALAVWFLFPVRFFSTVLLLINLFYLANSLV